MKESLGKTLFIDFYGLPGSGKSTISHLLAEKLRKRVTVSEPSYRLDHECSAIRRILEKICATVKLMTLYPRCFFKVVDIIKKGGIQICGHDFYLHLLNISYKIYCLRRSDNAFIIFDQGLWQSVMSLFYRKEDKTTFMGIYEDLRSLANEFVKVIDVYIKVDIDTAIERMDNRHTNISRVQLLSDEERIAELTDQMAMLEKIPNETFVFDSGKMSSEECVRGIISMIDDVIGHS